MIDYRETPARGYEGRVSPESWSGPARLELTVVPVDDRCTVTMIGTLDGWSAPALDTQYDQLLGAGFAEVFLDMRGVSEMDESGAVALTRLWARLRNCGVFCRLRGLAAEYTDNPVDLLLSIRAGGTHRWSVNRELGTTFGHRQV
jgi:anti-anti-sigma regulatory factor